MRPGEPYSRELQALERVALLYYRDHLTQGEIAARLLVSRSTVVRLLQQARRRAVVQIRVVTSKLTNSELERQLVARFGLQQARVAPSGLTAAEALAAVGVEAANFIADVLKKGDTMVLATGRSVGALVDAMPAMDLPETKIVEMQGIVGLPTALPEFSTDDVVARLAYRIGAQYRMLPVPRHLESAALVSAFLSDARIQSTLELARAADIAVVGIGGLDPPSPTLPPMPAQALHDLRARGAVGEISARFFDTDGRPCSSELDGRLIGLTLTDLLSIPVRVAIARGREKVPAVAAALAGRFANVVVTDVDTAAALIAYASSSQTSVGARQSSKSLAHARGVSTLTTRR